ncbi:MAG: DnaJ domain-containing protein [Gammaproteobacteria bacterium]|nr:DnaJ domain-containing protein [Gammaproteobacteria bacterium]
MEYKDYYKILGVERDTEEAEIKTAYRRLARKFHPDVSKEPNAEQKFKELGEAYEVLKDSEKRQAYDQLGANWKSGQNFNPPPDWQGGFSSADFSGARSDISGFSDFFEALFSGGGGFTQGQHSGFQTQGADQHSNISISLEDAFKGVKKPIRIGNRRNLEVKIPAGITTGKRIRLAGQGAAGAGGGPSGDLYLEVQVLTHSIYKLDGRNVLLDLPISPWEAALGARIQVPTLGGRVEATIPKGSQSGKKLRLKKRGLPGSPDGDQIVTLKIVMPTASTEEDQQFYRDMGKRFVFNPRKTLDTYN